jgi:tRNA pseudouridine38-40 synthase
MLLEYDGTRYSGWQIQKNARTVQGELLRAMREVFKSADLDVQGAGRTDAGVHAKGQVAHLEVQTVLAPEIIRMKVNDLLPPDINLLEVEKAPSSFHARHDAVARVYQYVISKRRTAFGKRFVWWIKDPLDVDAMRRAARHFTGMKDWRAFTDADPEDVSTKAMIHMLTVAEEGDHIIIRVEGSHFLWKLVRRIVGVLVEVGRGTLPEQEVPTVFSSGADYAARHTAPPSGLFLEGVIYAVESGPGGVKKPAHTPLPRKHRKGPRGRA